MGRRGARQWSESRVCLLIITEVGEAAESGRGRWDGWEMREGKEGREGMLCGEGCRNKAWLKEGIYGEQGKGKNKKKISTAH